jgi:hypothetical protein
VPSLSEDSITAGNVSLTGKAAHDESLLNFMKNIERFCNEVVSNKLFWTPDILLFFQLPAELLPEFEVHREREYRRRRQALDGSHR